MMKGGVCVGVGVIASGGWRVPCTRQPAARLGLEANRHWGYTASPVGPGGGSRDWSSSCVAVQAGFEYVGSCVFTSVVTCHEEPSQVISRGMRDSKPCAPVSKAERLLSGTLDSRMWPASVANVHVTWIGTRTCHCWSVEGTVQKRWQF